jgi:integrase
MVCETILVSAARVEGLLNLTIRGIDLEECVLWLDEKNDKLVPQPVPDWFAAKLMQFARSRGAVDKDDPVFLKRPRGRRPAAPITQRRMDNNLFGRLQAAYEWADTDQVTAHVLRHHAITVVERLAGKAVARAYARTPPATSTTSTPRPAAPRSQRSSSACTPVTTRGCTASRASGRRRGKAAPPDASA